MLLNAGAMIYKKYIPHKSLEEFVECYFMWHSENKKEEMVVESPPTGFCSIVFNFGDPYFLQNKKYERLAVPSFFVAGQSIYSYKLQVNGILDMVGIVLKPAALNTLFNLPTFEFTEERIDLSTVFNNLLAARYIQAIKDSADGPGRIRALEAFIKHYANEAEKNIDYIDHAANRIVESKGMIDIPALIAESCMSRRTFERRFFQKVGLSPKYYARIRRIGHLCNLIAGKQKVNWPEVFYECEFYDQAHFIKDFTEFTGRSPSQYLQENAELAKLISKPLSESLD